MPQDRMQSNDSRQTTPRAGSSIPMPNVSNVMARANRSLDKVRVSHGANEQYFDGISGKAVGQVRKSLREVFNIPGDAEAVVDGKTVGDDFVLQSGQHLEFSKSAGVKGYKLFIYNNL